MSTSRAPSVGRSESLPHPPGTPSSTEWVCQACQAERNVISELVMTDGHMVCPKCALVDAVATSAKSHVDLSADQSQIFDPLQSLQTLDAGWAQRDESLDRVFMVSSSTLPILNP
jgi:DNA-directed RNA polymerase subunit RPC12/RpoP